MYVAISKHGYDEYNNGVLKLNWFCLVHIVINSSCNYVVRTMVIQVTRERNEHRELSRGNCKYITRSPNNIVK